MWSPRSASAARSAFRSVLGTASRCCLGSSTLRPPRGRLSAHRGMFCPHPPREKSMSQNDGKNDPYDVIVIGAGPGGLAAGMYAARAKLKSIVLEKGLPGGQINNTGLIEDYPGFSTFDARE